jgi:hypothetical protein
MLRKYRRKAQSAALLRSVSLIGAPFSTSRLEVATAFLAVELHRMNDELAPRLHLELALTTPSRQMSASHS